MSVLEISSLRFGYGGSALLPPLDCAVSRGELWVVVGPNGCGKTTLLRTILGLIAPVSGAVALRGVAGYVPQRSQMDLRFPGRAMDVVLGGTGAGWSFLRPGGRAAARQAVLSALDEVGLRDKAHTRYAQLSEGQKQRVLIARSIVGAPELLLLDEPTSAMDISAEHRIMELLDGLRRERDLALIIVSHHLPVVAEFATHAIVLDREGDFVVAGRLSEIGELPGVVRRYGTLFSDPKCVASPEAAARAHGPGHHDH